MKISSVLSTPVLYTKLLITMPEYCKPLPELKEYETPSTGQSTAQATTVADIVTTLIALAERGW